MSRRGVNNAGQSLGRPTRFAVGVAFNPNTRNLSGQVARLKKKAQAGAHFAMTQPIYDPERFDQMVAATRDLRDGDALLERLPILAGLMPLLSERNAEFLHNEVPGVHVTPEIMERMRTASAISKEAGRDEGLKIARESLLEVRDLIQGVQVSAPFGNVKYALEVFSVLDGFASRTEVRA